MVAFMGFVITAQATGKGPIQNLTEHMSSPFDHNWTTNIGHCALPASVNIGGAIDLPLVNLWPCHAL